ncbi:MAG: DUF3109 family protein [Muribaculaceae bacterium]|nr:DUF3109 family protein [Muribaculaceae bacterium]
MIQIQDTVVSTDLIEEFFCCDIDRCKGACCIEGDAGAPLSAEEFEKIQNLLPDIIDTLTPAGQRAVREDGVGYYDPDGDLVTTLVDGAACAFAGFCHDGICTCMLEKAFSAGKTNFRKPESCALYPVRLQKFKSFTAVNFHRWKICKPAFTKGRKLNIRAYEFLKEPLTKRFGKEWYDELELTAREYIRQFNK